MLQTPVKELDQLLQPVLKLSNITLRPHDTNPLAEVRGKTFDLRLHLSATGRVSIDLPAGKPEYTVEYDPTNATLAIDRTKADIQSPATFPKRYQAPMPLRDDGTVSLRILIDHSSLEIYANDGELTMSAFILPRPAGDGLMLKVESGACSIPALRIDRVRSAALE
jgi:sucrose-6-phosphate hydrolase SacC (GH32 family)